MSRSTYLFLTSDRTEKQALGYWARVDGLNSVFETLDESVYCESVRKVRFRRVPEVLSFGIRKDLFVPHHENVIVFGAPVAISILKQLSVLKRNGAKVLVDICDSWHLLSQIQNTNVFQDWKSFVRLKLKILLVWLMYLRLGLVADNFSFISQRDYESDLRFIKVVNALRRILGWQEIEVLILPNGLKKPRQDIEYWNLDGPLVAVGDWSYPPNQKMLATLVDWLKMQNDERIQVKIYGPNLRDVPDGVSYVGWVEDLDEIFLGACSSFAVLESGAGMKNKCLDSISHGIPVIANQEALNGLVSDELVIPWRYQSWDDIHEVSILLKKKHAINPQAGWHEVGRILQGWFEK